MTVRRRRGAAALLGVLLVSISSAAALAQSDLAFTRAKHLQRGINLSMWYAQANDYSAARLARFTTADDFKIVHDLGFDHVRLSIDPVPLIADAAASGTATTTVAADNTPDAVGQAKSSSGTLALDAPAIARLDATIAQLTALGLVVVVDIHPGEDWKKNATNTDDGTAAFLRFWTSLAQHFATTDPAQVYFEILNEPEGVNAYRWAGEQARLVALIRSAAPHHTIIATGEGWGGIDGLLALEPVRDDNVIYSFHDYEPFEFTHQGATWAGDNLKPLRAVPYPSTPENVAPLLDNLTDAAAKKDLAWYGHQQQGIAQVRQRLGLAVAWARARHVPLWCGEFGVYRAFAPAADRARWLTDMRTTLEADGIGWNMWDYQASFGIVTKKDGTTTVDPTVAKALGLKPQP